MELLSFIRKLVSKNKTNIELDNKIYNVINPRISYFKNTKNIISIRFDCEFDFMKFISEIDNIDKFKNVIILVDDTYNNGRYVLTGDIWTKIWAEEDGGQNNDEFEIELIKSLSENDEVAIGYYNDLY